MYRLNICQRKRTTILEQRGTSWRKIVTRAERSIGRTSQYASVSEQGRGKQGEIVNTEQPQQEILQSYISVNLSKSDFLNFILFIII